MTVAGPEGFIMMRRGPSTGKLRKTVLSLHLLEISRVAVSYPSASRLPAARPSLHGAAEGFSAACAGGLLRVSSRSDPA